jgi:hypothetical protein
MASSQDYARLTLQRWIGTTARALRTGLQSRPRTDPTREAYKDAQIVADALLINPNSNMFGLYYLNVVVLAELTGLARDEILRALVILREQDYAYYDEASEYVWVREMARVQMSLPLKPADKRVTAANTFYAATPANPFKTAFFDRYRADLHLAADLRPEPLQPTPPITITRPVAAPPPTPTPPAAEVSLMKQWFLILRERFPSPRRMGGPRVETLFEAAVTKAEASGMAGHDFVNLLIEALEAQKQSAQWRQGVVPTLENWLEKERWIQDLGLAPGLRARFDLASCTHGCRSAAAHLTRLELEQSCQHDPPCTSFLEHFGGDRDLDAQPVKEGRG